MPDPAQTQPLDPLQIINARLSEIAQDARLLPQIQAQLTILMEGYDRLEKALYNNVDDLRKRDDAQQRAIDELRVRISENSTAISVLSSELKDLRREHENCPLTKAQESAERTSRQVERLFDITSQQGSKISGIEVRLNRRADEIENYLEDDLYEHLQACSVEFQEWRPWLKGIKWAVLIVGGVFVTALAVALLWAIVTSGAGLP